jgi:hypothetical protein
MMEAILSSEPSVVARATNLQVSPSSKLGLFAVTGIDLHNEFSAI